MIRSQIQLTVEEASELKDMARREGASVAEMVRRAVDSMLARERSVSRAELKARAIAVCGRFASDATDVSTRHDDYLGEAFR
jgi:hypothetical protein